MEIQRLRKKDEKEWDAFVRERDDATFFHQIGWKKVIEKTYNHKSYYLLAKEDGEIKGILPLFLMKSALFGKRLISVPFASYGGVCADNRQIKEMLINEAKKNIEENDLDYLELRNREDFNYDLQSKKIYYSLILKLNPNFDILWKNFRRSMRRNVKKAMKNDMFVTLNSKDINGFYKIYAHNMRDLGTPVHNYSLFKNLIDEFPNHTNISTIQYNERVIAAIFLIYFKKIILDQWASSLKRYDNLYPNYLLFWEVIKSSCEQGFEYFDLLRSQQNSGTFLFKAGWGAEPMQLNYLYYLNKLQDMPNDDPSNPKYNTFTQVWKRLPVSIATIIGPKIRKNIP